MIELKQVCWEPRSGRCGVQDVSFCLGGQGITVLLGDGGSGKDTLLRILGGLDRPDKGEVLFRGQSRKETAAERESWRGSAAGFALGGSSLLENETVFANIELSMRLVGMDKADRRRRASQLIRRMGLQEKANLLPGRLSSAERVSAEIARALANDPEMLLLAEPLDKLNREEAERTLELLRAVAKDRPVVFTAREDWLGDEGDVRCIRMLGGRVLSDSEPRTEEETAPSSRLAHPILGIGDAWRFMRKAVSRRKGALVASALTAALSLSLLSAAMCLPRSWEETEKNVEEDALSVQPVVITRSELEDGSLLDRVDLLPSDSDHARDAVYAVERRESWESAADKRGTETDLNALLAALREDEAMSRILSAVQYDDGTELHIYASDTTLELKELSPCSIENVWAELPGDRAVLERQYDVIAGRWPASYDELVLFVDEDNEIDDMRLEALGLLNWETGRQNYETILAATYRLMKPTDYYQAGADGRWARIDGDTDLLRNAVNGSMKLHVVGIVRPSSRSAEHCFTGTMGYTSELLRHVAESVENSEAVTRQREDPTVDIFTALPFMPEELRGLDSYGKAMALRAALETLGVAEKMAIYSELTGCSQADAAAMVSGGTLDAALAEKVDGMGEGRLSQLCDTYILSAYSEGRYEDNLSRLGANGGIVTELRLYTSDFADREALLTWLRSYNRSAVRDGRPERAVELRDDTATLRNAAQSGGRLLPLLLSFAAAVAGLVTVLALRARMQSSAHELRDTFSTLTCWGVGVRDASLVLRLEALASCLCGAGAGILLSWALCAVLNATAGRLWGVPLHLTLTWKEIAALPAVSVILALLSTLDGGKQVARIARY